MITQSELKRELHYDPDTGIFTRISKYKGPALVGDIAGRMSGKTSRYSSISIGSIHYQSHKLAFLYMTGKYPSECVDHINGDTFDNRWSNIRLVTAGENNKNKSTHGNNKSGVMGVHWSKKEKSWKAQINVNGKRIHLGYFKDFFEAVCVRKSAQNKHGFHLNHGRMNPAKHTINARQ